MHSALNRKRLDEYRRSKKCSDNLAKARAVMIENMSLFPERRQKRVELAAIRFAGRKGQQKANAWNRTMRPHDIRCTKLWYFKSPDGRYYEFRNLALFAKKNADEFGWDPTKAKRGLGELRPSNRGTRQPHSWHGWTWCGL